MHIYAKNIIKSIKRKLKKIKQSISGVMALKESGKNANITVTC